MSRIDKTVCDACGNDESVGGWSEISSDQLKPTERVLAHVCSTCRCQASIPEDSARRLGNRILLNLVKRR